MSEDVICMSLEEVRTNIDRIDREIVVLLAERGGYVQQAVKFKKPRATCRRLNALSRSLPK